jgi:hypothetical protein
MQSPLKLFFSHVNHAKKGFDSGGFAQRPAGRWDCGGAASSAAATGTITGGVTQVRLPLAMQADAPPR